MVERYDWRYVVRSAHGRNAGANLDRRGEVWRYRRTLPADLRDRAVQTEIARGLGRIALAEAEHLYQSMQFFPEHHLQQPEQESPSLSQAVDHYEREQWAAGRRIGAEVPILVQKMLVISLSDKVLCHFRCPGSTYL